MELFDFIKILFTNPKEYSSITSGEKRKQYFMLSRRIAINFPLQANALQHIKINQSAVVDFWQNFIRKQYKYVPGWMYTKGVKKTQEIKERKMNISNDVINEYCKVYKLDKKTVLDALEFYNAEMVNELKHFENLLKQR